MDLHAWHAGGERRRLGDHDVFVRVDGSGKWLTLLHGFPSSSWDYAKVVPKLSGFRTLAVDFLGFGNSDKPRDLTYSIARQADLVVAAWQALGVTETAIVAHDYGDTVTSELLARELPVKITGVMFMNGSIYGDMNELLLVQKLLRVGGIGAVITRLISEGLFRNSFLRVFATPPSDAELHQHWEAICLRGGNTLYHRLVYFYGDIEREHARWEAQTEGSPVPRHFLWGMADPVSTSAMLARAKERSKQATFVELPGVSHYPHLEAPDAVAAEIQRRLA